MSITNNYRLLIPGNALTAYVSLLCLIFLSSCRVNHFDQEKIEMEWEKYLYTLKIDSLDYNLKNNWKSSQLAPDLPLFTILKESDFFKVKPKIISVQKRDTTAIIKTEFYLANGDLHCIYISMANKDKKSDSVFFSPYFEYYTSSFSKLSNGPIQYIYDSSSYVIDKEEALAFQEFNKKMANLFDRKELHFNFYIFKNTKERLLSEGYEYHYLSDKIQKHSAHADLNNNSISVGKHTSTYPHELVHLYTADYYPKVHTWFDEGLAEYLGNDPDKLKTNRRIIKDYIIRNKVDTRDILSIKDNLAKEGTSLKYDLGSLIVEKIHQKNSSHWLNRILLSGADDQSFYDLINSNLNVKPENLADSLLSWIN